MTYYSQQVLELRKKNFPDELLCERVIRAKRFIDNNFSNKIDLDRIASEAFFSKYHFLRLFKQFYGHTPHQYLTQARIQFAKQLLRSGFPVADACFMAGFESTSSFKGLFKRCTGYTPSTYQKNLPA